MTQKLTLIRGIPGSGKTIHAQPLRVMCGCHSKLGPISQIN